MTRSYLPGFQQQYGYPEAQQYGSGTIHDGSPMQGVEMQYSPSAAYMQSARQSVGQAQTQQYGGYQQSPLLGSNTQQAMYESLPQPYQQQQSRQSAAIEVMSSQLGALPGQYDPQTSLYTQQQQQAPQHPQYSSAARQSLVSHQQQPYASSSSSDYPSLHDATLPSSQQAQQSIPTSQPQGGPPQPSAAEAAALAQGLQDYQTSINTVLQLIISATPTSSSSSLTSAADRLLAATRWLVTHVQPLNLHHDVDRPEQYTERLTMWTRLNLAWEGLAEAMRTRAMYVSATSYPRSRSGGSSSEIGFSVERVRNLIEEVVTFCNDLEGFGLVDYELGLAEELIVAGLMGALDLVEAWEGDDGAEAMERQGSAPGAAPTRRRTDTAMSGIQSSMTTAVGMARSGA
jgi:hypothetical protein